MTCDPAAEVSPGGSSTCSWSIKATQLDLDFGSISRSFEFEGKPNEDLQEEGISGEFQRTTSDHDDGRGL
jgi:hypothetical protein